MRGTGKDGRKSYDWSFSRQIAAAMAAAAPQAAAPAAATPVADLVGEWDGTYANSPARLNITRQTGAEFGGVLTVTTRSGQAPTRDDNRRCEDLESRPRDRHSPHRRSPDDRNRHRRPIVV